MKKYIFILSIFVFSIALLSKREQKNNSLSTQTLKPKKEQTKKSTLSHSEKTSPSQNRQIARVHPQPAKVSKNKPSNLKEKISKKLSDPILIETLISMAEEFSVEGGTPVENGITDDDERYTIYQFPNGDRVTRVFYENGDTDSDHLIAMNGDQFSRSYYKNGALKYITSLEHNTMRALMLKDGRVLTTTLTIRNRAYSGRWNDTGQIYRTVEYVHLGQGEVTGPIKEL